LGGTVQQLNQENENLRNEIAMLRNENNDLRQQVSYLSSFFNSTTSDNSLLKKGQSQINSQSILLFVILISFGILWNLDSSIFDSKFIFNNNKINFLNDMKYNQYANNQKLFSKNIQKEEETKMKKIIIMK